MRTNSSLATVPPTVEVPSSSRVRYLDFVFPAGTPIRTLEGFFPATLFGNLAIMTSGAGFRPITLRRQLSLTLPVRWSGNHGQQS
jgi:hypothetical protein